MYEKRSHGCEAGSAAIDRPKKKTHREIRQTIGKSLSYFCELFYRLLVNPELSEKRSISLRSKKKGLSGEKPLCFGTGTSEAK